MSTKPRPLKVGERIFRWKVAPLGPAKVCLRIWREDERSRPWAEVMCRFDDPWLNFKELADLRSAGAQHALQPQPLRPRHVAEIIRMIVQRGGPASASPHHRYELGAAGSLQVLRDPLASAPELADEPDAG